MITRRSVASALALTALAGNEARGESAAVAAAPDPARGGPPKSILDYGASPNSDSIHAAVDAGFADVDDLYIPRGATFNLAANVAIPPGKRIFSDGGVVRHTAALTHGFELGTGSIIEGVTHVPGVPGTVFVYAPFNTARPVVRDNRFVCEKSDKKTFAVYLDRPVEPVVVGNRSDFGSLGIFCLGPQRALIQGNASYLTGRGILLYGGSGNSIVANRTSGGITGILNLSFRGPLGNAANAMFGNTVEGNIVEDTSEEGISFDVNGINPAYRPEHQTWPVVTVASASASPTQVTVLLSERGQTPAWCYQFWAVVLDGRCAGHIARIEEAADGAITLGRGAGNIAPLLQAGDHILITTGIIGNTVKGNTVRRAGTGAISFWGSSWANVIEGNALSENESDITVHGALRNDAPRADSLSCYSGMNNIHNNAIQGGYPFIAGRELAKVRAIEVGARLYFGGPTLQPYSIGDSITGNIIASGKEIRLENARHAIVRANRLAGSARIVFNGTHNCRYGANLDALGRLVGPDISSGTNTENVDEDA